jgi:ATP-dependent protease ClpP protease subunit
MKYLLALSLLLSSTPTVGETLNLLNTPKNHILRLEGSVTNALVLPMVTTLDRISSDNVPKRVVLIVDTVGGTVTSGYHLIAAMTLAIARNTGIDCVVAKRAYSMGVFILPYCSKVYALPHSLLLFHSIRSFTLSPLTSQFLTRELFANQTLAYEVEGRLRKAMGISKDKYERLRDMELYYPAIEFNRQFPNFITLVDNVILPPDVYLLAGDK